jgi:hypothetical protein
MKRGQKGEWLWVSPKTKELYTKRMANGTSSMCTGQQQEKAHKDNIQEEYWVLGALFEERFHPQKV